MLLHGAVLETFFPGNPLLYFEPLAVFPFKVNSAASGIEMHVCPEGNLSLFFADLKNVCDKIRTKMGSLR